MADEYQFRKEIDALKRAVDNIDVSGYVKSDEVNTQTNKLYSDLDVLSTDLTEFHGTLTKLRDNLVEFNGELISFSSDNQNYKEDLGKLKDNLHLFITSVNTFSSHLNSFGGRLDDFDDDMWGDEGFDARLDSFSAVLGDENSGLVKGLNDLEGALDGLNDDIFGEEGFDEQLTALLTVVGDNNSGLVKGLNDLDASLTQLGSDVSGLGSKVTGLMTAVGDSNSGLVKSMNTLQTTVGDNSSGLVKQVNTLDGALDQLSDDIFGTNGLDARLTSTEGSLSSTSSKLSKVVYSLDNLSDYLTEFEGNLSAFETTLENNPDIDTSKLDENIVKLFHAIGNVKNDVSDAQDGISDAEGKISATKTSINTVKTDLYGSKTVNGQTVPREPSDTPTNNSVKGGLRGLDHTINDNGGLIDQLGDVGDNIDNVKGEIYGTDSQGNPLNENNYSENSLLGKSDAVQEDIYGDGTAQNPGALANISTVKTGVNNVKTTLYGGDDGHSPSSPADTSVMGKAKAIRTDLYGSETGNASNYTSTSVKGHLINVKDTQIPNVKKEIFGQDSNGNPLNSSNFSDASLKGSIKNVKGTMYGTDNNGNPLDKTNYSENSLKGLTESLGEDVPALQNHVYGEGTTVILCTNSWTQYTIDTSGLTGTGCLEFRAYATSVVDIKTVAGTGISNGNFANNFNGWDRNDTSNKIAINTESSTKYVRMTSDLIASEAANVKTITQCNLNLSNINSITFYARKGTPQTDENSGTLVVFVGNKETSGEGLYVLIDNNLKDIDVAQGHIETLDGMMNGDGTAQNPGLINQVDNAITQIGDENSGLIKDVNTVQGDIGNVNRANGDSPLQTQIKQLPCYIERLWVCPSNSTNEVIKLASTGTARIGIKFTEVTKKALRDGGNVEFSPVIVSPSNVISGQNEGISLSLQSIPSNRIIYLNHNFNEIGLWKVMCENLSYTVQVGEVQSAIPNFNYAFVQTQSRVMCGLTVKTYSDGLNVYLTISGTLDGSSGVPAQNNDALIGGLLNSDYAPPIEMQTTVHSSHNFCRIRVTPTGEVYLTNGNASKSYNISGALYYPLKSRLP